MIKQQTILVYLLIFLVLSIILKIIGLIDVEGSEILGYALIFYGISLVYLSFGRNKKILLFIGSTFFLTGIALFLINNFDFNDNSSLIYPSILLIPGINFLLIFIEDNSSKVSLILSILLLLVGFYHTISSGSFNLNSFFSSIISITLKYWLIALILLGIIFLISREKND